MEFAIVKWRLLLWSGVCYCEMECVICEFEKVKWNLRGVCYVKWSVLCDVECDREAARGLEQAQHLLLIDDEVLVIMVIMVRVGLFGTGRDCECRND